MQLYATIVLVSVAVLVGLWLAEAAPSNIGWGTLSVGAELPTKFSLFQWNVKMLPWPIVTDALDRVDDILTKIRKQAADIVVLSEVIDSDAANRLVTGLQRMGYVWGTRPLQSWPRLNGGVLVASRYPPQGIDSVVFNYSTLKEADYLASKGIVRVVWKNAVVLATHLDACPGDIPTRIGQIEQMRQLTTDPSKTVWAGDFNFDLRFDAATYGIKPICGAAEPTFETKRIDGCITDSETVHIYEQVLNLEGSDHLPVMTTISLKDI